jgi:hypothetical protein
MSKSNKYKVKYKFVFNNRLLILIIKKLNLKIYFNQNNMGISFSDNLTITSCKIINNFYIHPNVIILLKSKDILNQIISKL